MHIIVRRAFGFNDPNTGAIVTANKLNEVNEVPDWVAKDELYKMALKDGLILELGKDKELEFNDVPPAFYSKMATESANINPDVEVVDNEKAPVLKEKSDKTEKADKK